jgi:hypothetical protein
MPVKPRSVSPQKKSPAFKKVSIDAKTKANVAKLVKEINGYGSGIQRALIKNKGKPFTSKLGRANQRTKAIQSRIMKHAFGGVISKEIYDQRMAVNAEIIKRGAERQIRSLVHTFKPGKESNAIAGIGRCKKGTGL